MLKISVDGEPLRSRLFAGKGGDGVIPLSDFRTAVESLCPGHFYRKNRESK